MLLPMLSGELTVIWAVFAVLVINSESCFSASISADAENAANSQICDTQGCKDTASAVLSSMDSNVNPCDNFYKFACGKFEKDTFIPDEKSKVDLFDDMTDEIQTKLKADLEGQMTSDDPRTFQLLQDFYKSCTNEDQINANSENELKEILKELGGWPVLDGESWDEASFEWTKLVVELRKKGYSVNYFVKFSVDTDLNDEKKRVVTLDQAETAVARDYLAEGLTNDITKAYSKYMVDLAVILGANRENAEKELAEALKFEMQIANVSLSSDARSDKSTLNNPTPVSKLQEDYNFVPWLEYINNILAPQAKVELSDKVTVYEPTFLGNLTVLLENTPRRVLANYALWRVVADSASRLSERVRNAEAEFSASKTGTNLQEARWKQCLSFLSNSLYTGIGALYVSRHFDKSAKGNASEIMSGIQVSYEKILQKVEWMDQTTKEAALAKLGALKSSIGYPEEILDKAKLDEYYKDLSADPKSYLKSHLDYNLFQQADSFGKLGKPVDKANDWLEYAFPAIVNAFYDQAGNAVVFPAGILQGKFFTHNRPKYMNFGAIGQFIGHEITHGFDDEGSQYNKDGKLENWWQDETKQEYEKRIQCMVDQYNNYKVEQVGLNVNGKKTLGENIADNGGIKEAYFAYLDWEANNGQEPQLPGLNYSSRQMFWISAATVWCNKYRDDPLKNQINTDVHTPGEYRVIGPMSNMPEFSKDFNCPAGSTMNPERRCTVW